MSDRPEAMKRLKRANEVRTNGAKLRRRLKANKITLEKALDHKDAQALKVPFLLASQHRWGQKRARKLLFIRLNFSGSIGEWRVRELTQRQKDLIVKGAADPDFWVK